MKSSNTIQQIKGSEDKTAIRVKNFGTLGFSATEEIETERGE